MFEWLLDNAADSGYADLTKYRFFDKNGGSNMDKYVGSRTLDSTVTIASMGNEFVSWANAGPWA